MKVVTLQFGELEVAEEQIIRFPKGIIGFEECHEFVIIADEEYDPFRWLISLDREEIGFPILDPFLVKPDYLKEFPASIVRELESENTVMDVFCVVTLKGEGGKVTLNLKGPIIVDYLKGEGRQIILPSEELSVSYPLT